MHPWPVSDNIKKQSQSYHYEWDMVLAFFSKNDDYFSKIFLAPSAFKKQSQFKKNNLSSKKKQSQFTKKKQSQSYHYEWDMVLAFFQKMMIIFSKNFLAPSCLKKTISVQTQFWIFFQKMILIFF
jgi:hypothetical protein